MILEQLTHNSFGYYSTDICKSSHKKIIICCDKCGQLRIVQKRYYYPLCRRCGIKKITYEIEPELLWALYWGNEYKQEEIADIFGYSKSVIHTLMVKHNIPARSWNELNKIEIEEELLWALYWGNGYPTTKIAKIFDTYNSVISYKMDNYEIPKRSRGESKKGYPGWNKGLTKETDERVASISKNLMGHEVADITRKRISKANFGKTRGPKNGQWEGGCSPIYMALRNCSYMQRWRREIFKRDNYRCQICDIIGKNGILHVHHTIPYIELINDNNIETLEDAYECDALWDIDNGMTLCGECHMKLHGLNNKNDNVE